MKSSQSCENCGAPALGAYCSTCGQKTPLQHRTVNQLIGDVLRELFSFDNGFFRSLRHLIFNPGQLTLEYIHGRRARYLPPFRLFLLSILLFLLVFTAFVPLLKNHFPVLYASGSGGLNVDVTVTQRAEEVRAEVDEQTLERHLDENDLLSSLTSRDELTQKFTRSLLLSVQMVMIVLAPVFAALVALFQRKRSELYYVDHLVFAMHIHAFVFIYISFTALIPHWNLVVVMQYLIPVGYLLFAMRRVYRRGWVRTVAATIVVSGLYLVIVFSVLLIVAYVQAFGVGSLKLLG